MRQLKYTSEQLQVAVQTSTSMRQTLAKLGVSPSGGNRLANLRLLCPNGHALTPTYRSTQRSRGLSSGLQSPP